MNRHNHNEAITKVAMPERKMHVLIPWEEKGSSGNFFSAVWPEEEVDKTLFGFVLVVDDRYLANYLQSRRAFEKSYGKVPEVDAKRLRFLLELADAVSRRKPKLAVKAIKRAFGERPTFAALQVWNMPLTWLTGIFNSALENCRLLVWYSKITRKMALGTFAKDSVTALYLLALARLGDLGAIGTCKRCNELFFRKKPSKRYCSDRCSSANAMARWRKRHKRDSRKKAQQS